CPTSRSPPSVKPTMDGVVRLPSLLGITTGSPPSITETQLLVVPRSIPMTLLMTTQLPRRVPPARACAPPREDVQPDDVEASRALAVSRGRRIRLLGGRLFGLLR